MVRYFSAGGSVLFHCSDMAQTWQYSPTRPEPEPCWTPYQKCGFSLDDSHSFPSSKSFWICLSPHNSTNSMTFCAEKNNWKTGRKRERKILSLRKTCNIFCTDILVFLLRAICVLHSLPGSNTGAVHTSSNRARRKRLGRNTPWEKTSSGSSTFFQFQKKIYTLSFYSLIPAQQRKVCYIRLDGCPV